MTASKNKPAQTRAERKHVEAVKSLPCALCGAPGPSEAHEIEQGLWWLSVPLCAHCHRHAQDGLHGAKRLWSVMKATELSLLNETLRRMFQDGRVG